MSALFSDAISPLATFVSPPTLARLRATCKVACAVVDASSSRGQLCWIASAKHAGLPETLTKRQDLAAHYQRSCVFCCDVTASATVLGQRITLDLGASPPNRRVAAAHSIVSVRRFRQLNFAIRELRHEANHHCVLWIGLVYDKNGGSTLDHRTHDAALAGYHVYNEARSMGERFTRTTWSMNAVGSSGAVWSDASVVRILGRRFGEGDSVSLILDDVKRELRVRVSSGCGGGSSSSSRSGSSSSGSRVGQPDAVEAVAVRRLMRSARDDAPPPRMHAIVQLTDVAHPNPGRPARAVVDVIGAQ